MISMRGLPIVFMLMAAPIGVGAQSDPVAPQEGPPAPADANLSVAAADSPALFELSSIEPGEEVTLEDAIRMTDERNLSLEAIRTEIASADAELYRAWSALFPAANASMTLTHLDHPDTVNIGGGTLTTRHQNSLSGAIEVKMPIVSPMAWAGIGVGRAGLDLAELTVTNARQALLMMVVQSYYQALTAKRLIDVHAGQVQSAARHLEVSRTRLVSGVGKRLDVIRARGDLVRIREQMISALGMYDNSRDTLGRLTGISGLATPVDVVEGEIAPDESDKELVERGEKNREDLHIKEALVDLYEKQLTVSWMQFLPSLNASWQLSHQFTETSDMGDPDITRWAAYLVLSVPIYSQTRYADLDARRASVAKAKIESEDARLGAALEIRMARRDYMTAISKIETASQQAELAREALILVETDYRMGTGSSLAVTDARRSNSEAEINLASKQFEAQASLLALLRAVGADISKIVDGMDEMD